MPTKREREYYRMGFRDGRKDSAFDLSQDYRETFPSGRVSKVFDQPKPRKRKLSAWNKFVKANSRKKEFRYANGKLKLKKMGIAFRRKKRR